MIEYVVKWRITCHECVAKHFIYLWVYVQGITSLGHNQYTGVLSIQAQKALKLWDQILWELLNNHAMPSLVFVVTQRTSCYGYFVTHYFCGCIVKVWQAWDNNQYTAILFIQASKHSSCGTRFGRNYKSTMPSSGWCMLLYDKPRAMDMLPSIPYVLSIHGQDLVGLKHN